MDSINVKRHQNAITEVNLWRQVIPRESSLASKAMIKKALCHLPMLVFVLRWHRVSHPPLGQHAGGPCVGDDLWSSSLFRDSFGFTGAWLTRVWWTNSAVVSELGSIKNLYKILNYLTETLICIFFTINKTEYLFMFICCFVFHEIPVDVSLEQSFSSWFVRIFLYVF